MSEYCHLSHTDKNQMSAYMLTCWLNIVYTKAVKRLIIRYSIIHLKFTGTLLSAYWQNLNITAITYPFFQCTTIQFQAILFHFAQFLFTAQHHRLLVPCSNSRNNAGNILYVFVFLGYLHRELDTWSSSRNFCFAVDINSNSYMCQGKRGQSTVPMEEW